MYKLLKNTFTEEIVCVQKQLNDVLFSIPFDPANTDAQQFALWLQDGGIPEPATEGEVVTPEWITETIAKLLPNG